MINPLVSCSLLIIRIQPRHQHPTQKSRILFNLHHPPRSAPCSKHPMADSPRARWVQSEPSILFKPLTKQPQITAAQGKDSEPEPAPDSGVVSEPALGVNSPRSSPDLEQPGHATIQDSRRLVVSIDLLWPWTVFDQERRSVSPGRPNR